MTPTPTTSPALDAATARAVEALADRAAAHDGADPLSEAFRLALTTERDGTTHLLTPAAGGEPAAYAQRHADGSAELVVDPDHRRRGLGGAQLDALLALGPTRVWAHGDLPAARALAASRGLTPVRALHLMARPLTPADATAPALPRGYAVRPFVVGEDEQGWLATNAAAFATHPEQGSLTLEDLRAREELAWFDPQGLLLVEATEAPGEIAAFHWTKVEPGSRSGEVYVLGVHPAHQGRGLAGPLTALGLAHLARQAPQGIDEVHLYVDGDNAPALATYRRAGFVDRTVDVMYAPGAPAPTA